MSPRPKNTQSPNPHFERVGAYHGIEEYRHKKNGLRVLYRYDDTAPVAGFMVTYLVGSRHEAVGYTGATHLLEHLMFKGSKKFPSKKGVSPIDRLQELGALMNATTWLDRTNYYEVLPDEHIEFAIELEADRMRNAILTEKDRAEEMPAVRSEYAMRVNNEPQEFLDEQVWATAFMAHPYHHPTIGWQDDFERVSIERLQHFYNEYYWPNNAVVTLLGSVERTRALALLQKYFGGYPKSPRPIHEPYTKEPVQLGRRFVEVKRTGVKDIVCVAYKIPEALHADTPALFALKTILADGATSRLYKALVEKKLCSDIQGTYFPMKDPSLMLFYATLTTSGTHAKIERIIRAECARMAHAGVSEHELSKVQAGLETEIAFARDGHYAMLSALNEAIAVGDWRFFFDLPAALRELAPKQVQETALRYFVDDHMTVGHYQGHQG